MIFILKYQKFIFIKGIFLLLVIFINVILPDNLLSANYTSEYWDRDFHKSHINIKSTTGKFYAYIVLLFNENPHFINLIQEGSISPDMLQNQGFQIKEYHNYQESIRNTEIKRLAEVVLNIYMHPNKFSEKSLDAVQEELAKVNVILRFSKVKNRGSERIVLDYCVFGRKEPINISHPFFGIQEKIFNIQPFIYYDEFSTSNSTFYFNMIYINPEEVHNDYLIAQKIINGRNVDSMFFVGAKVNDNIKYCIMRAFKNSKYIKKEILNMFVVHEITHKILNNHYNFYNQVAGEELALLSTIYFSPYLGLSVLYSYLDYNRINPHRIAATNIIRYFATKYGKPGLIDDPTEMKFLSINDIKQSSKEQFNSIIKSIK